MNQYLTISQQFICCETLPLSHVSKSIYANLFRVIVKSHQDDNIYNVIELYHPIDRPRPPPSKKFGSKLSFKETTGRSFHRFCA